MYPFLSILILSFFEGTRGICDDSYMIFCDNLSDIVNYKVWNWTEVVIGSSEGNSVHTTIDSDIFENFEEIKMLFIVDQVNKINKGVFKTAGQKLKVLKFFGNDLQTVESETFSGFRKLSRLGLVNNNIHYLEEFAFKGSVIKNLDLSRNKLTTIVEHTFDDCDISNIKLRENRLTYINSNAFNGRLEVLNLDYNQLETIENRYLQNSPKLKEITISHNKLTQILDISAVENIIKLDFSFNQINFVNSIQFEDFKELEYLDLSENQLQKFSLKHLKKVKSEKMILLLNDNLLIKLKVPNMKPIAVTLYGNPWNCDCLGKIEEKFKQYRFMRTQCDSKLFGSGGTPICLEQGDCENASLTNGTYLQNFIELVKRQRRTSTCDISYKVGIKQIDIIPNTP